MRLVSRSSFVRKGSVPVAGSEPLRYRPYRLSSATLPFAWQATYAELLCAPEHGGDGGVVGVARGARRRGDRLGEGGEQLGRAHADEADRQRVRQPVRGVGGPVDADDLGAEAVGQQLEQQAAHRRHVRRRARQLGGGDGAGLGRGVGAGVGEYVGTHMRWPSSDGHVLPGNTAGTSTRRCRTSSRRTPHARAGRSTASPRVAWPSRSPSWRAGPSSACDWRGDAGAAS